MAAALAGLHALRAGTPCFREICGGSLRIWQPFSPYGHARARPLQTNWEHEQTVRDGLSAGRVLSEAVVQKGPRITTGWRIAATLAAMTMRLSLLRGTWRLAAASMAVAVTLAGAAPAGAGVLSDTIKGVKPGVVGVGSYQHTRRPPALLLGTGFVVGDGLHVVTSTQVLAEEVNANGMAFVTVFVGVGNSVERRRTELVAEDPDHGISILRIAGPPLPALTLGRDDAVEEGQAVAFTGFPRGVFMGLNPATHRGIVSALTTITAPTHSPRRREVRTIMRLRAPYRVFQLDALAYPGNSGSPLYDPETGAVYGVVSSASARQSRRNPPADPSGITYAVPIRYVHGLLKEMGLLDTF